VKQLGIYMDSSKKYRTKSINAFVYPKDWDKFLKLCQNAGTNAALSISDFITYITEIDTKEALTILRKHQDTRISRNEQIDE